MDKVQNLTKLQTPICDTEGYCSGDSSSPSPKSALLSETETAALKYYCHTNFDDRHKWFGRGDG